MQESSERRIPAAKLVACLGFAQIIGWGTSFYFPGALAEAIVKETGWPLGGVVGGVSIGLLVGGLVSPRVGRAISRHGGRPVLALGSLLFAAGLTGIAAAPVLPVYLAAWAVVGLGMGCGLYDAAFAALGTLYGNAARAPITNLTLLGGFGSTVFWPLGAALVETVGWRATALIYAALHLAVALPLVWFALPPGDGGRSTDKDKEARVLSDATLTPAERLPFVLFALVLTISSAIGAVVIVHLLILLQARGLSFAAAVSLGALFGPAQVGARLIESFFGRHYHPIWTMVASCLFMAIGLALMLVNVPIAAAAIVIYGCGYGVMWIARGTLPLSLFGAERYARLIGRLALPALIAQALAPSLGAVLLEHTSAHRLLAVLVSFAVFNVALIVVLWAVCRPVSPRPASPSAIGVAKEPRISRQQDQSP